MGKGLLSGLFWGGAASMIVLTAASLYFPLRDISERSAPRGPVADRVLLADPPSPPSGADVQATIPDPAPVPESPEPSGSELPARTAPAAADAPTDAPEMAAVQSETPPSLPAQPEPPAGPAPEVAETAPQDPELASPAPTAPGLAAPMAPRARAEGAGRAPALPQPNETADAGPGRALAALSTPARVPEVTPEAPQPALPEMTEPVTTRPQPLAPPDLPRAAVSELRPPASEARPPVPVPSAQPDPPATGAEAPDAAAPPDVPGTAEVARPETQPPRLALAPGDLPIPSGPAPEIPPAASQGAGETDAAPERAEPVPDAPVPPVAAETPAPEQAALPQEPRRLVLGGGQGFGSGGPGLSARIPRIGELPAAAEAAPEPEATPLGALARNARPFEGAEGVPRLSVVLQATSDARAITDILSRLRAPVAVALDPTWPEAAARAEELQAAGHEVLITLTGLPTPAEPRDIDTALAVHIARLPGAMGVWLPADSQVFAERDLMRHLVDVLAETGHGLVAPRFGLDAVGQEARAAGLPAVSITRRIDGAPDAVALQRALDQGALRAGVEGASVLLGETRADTLQALRLWAEGRSADTLALAPVSALLLDPAL